ncbi:MAG: polysaccharide deacetylase family protein [Clostridia bacterium]|nr:polysaccharide deacetylase family protein [Clostridia bacterium]
MWNGKKKAITFSFDDGVTQDIRLIEIFNKYGLKCTFNLNSEALGVQSTLTRNGRVVPFNRVPADKVKEIYQGYEIAAHTLTHPNLRGCSDEEIIRQVEQDRKNLSKLCGCEVVGMAYPGGGYNPDDHAVEVVKQQTGVRYARTTRSTKSFTLQKDNYFCFYPSTYIIEEDFEKTVDEFLALDTDEPQLLYIWGHAFEFDAEYISWENFERICKKLSGKADIFYGTNKEVLL